MQHFDRIRFISGKNQNRTQPVYPTLIAIHLFDPYISCSTRSLLPGQGGISSRRLGHDCHGHYRFHALESDCYQQYPTRTGGASGSSSA